MKMFHAYVSRFINQRAKNQSKNAENLFLDQVFFET